MDAAINGDICEEPFEKDKGTEIKLVADGVLSCDKDVLKENTSPCHSPSPENNLPNSDEKLPHIINSEELPHNGSADDLGEIEANDSDTSKLSPKENCDELSGAKVVDDEGTVNKNDDVEHSDELLSSTEVVTDDATDKDKTESPSENSKSKVCDESENLSDENEKNTVCSSAAKSPDHEQLSESTLPEDKQIEKTVSVNKSVSSTEVSGTSLESELPVSLENHNDSNPLAQLNQHLKSIGCDDDDDGASKMEHDLSNNESSKTCPKEATSPVDRHKESNCFVFTEISKEESGFPDVFTGLVVIGKYLSVKGDFTLRSSEALVESASLTSPYLVKEPDTFPAKLNDSKPEPKDFFHSTAGEMLIGIGLGRVSEWFHRDMARIKKRQMKREGKNPELEEDLKMHETFYGEAKRANRIYSFSLNTCKTCGFSTESSIVMEGHLLVPHITPRREYQCNFCEVVNRDPKGMLEHMYRIHGKTGRIQPPVLFFECPYCTFESNSKVKLGNHLGKCQRIYDPSRNQAPPKDFEFPALTPKPITVAVVKAYEKSLCSMQRGRGRPKKIDSIAEQIALNQYPSPMGPMYRAGSTGLSENLQSLPNQMISPLQMPNMNLRPNMGPLRTGGLSSPMHLPSPPNRFYPVVNSSAQLMPMLANSPLSSQSQFSFSPNLVNSISGSKKLPSASPQFLNSFFGSGGLRTQNPSNKNVPEVTITPLPKLTGPYPVPTMVKPSTGTHASSNSQSSNNSLVVCEICDGYIKDLEQLRSHMQLIHKVKIHPKMLVSRPPLNCQKCQWRFFTDQGLERHLLGAHGLVTSNMQELANKSKDAGCCTICGRVYGSKLVSHMNQVHKLTLKPAHLSYKCTVCSATFNLYRLFENHVYLVHSGAAKRSSASSDVNSSSKKLKSADFDDRSDDGACCTDCGKQFRRHSAQSEKCLKCDGNSKLSL